MSNQISSISISGEITLNLHSLNNEGGEGNQVLTRQVTIIDSEKNESTETAISGDMLKHIHAAHMVNYCVENSLALSDYSRLMNPNRVSATELRPDAGDENQGKEDVIDALINRCALCDAHGVLITDKVGKNKESSNTPRASVIEFSWAVGIPGLNNTESYIHTKLVPNSSSDNDSANEKQNIFHKPANHGVYAFVCNIETYRIGLNDINRRYAIDDNERINRYKAILASLLSTILDPAGAMTSSQKPHITNFRGVVTYSMNLNTPAPVVSAINPEYRKEIESIKTTLNTMFPNTIESKVFDSISDFSTIIGDLFNDVPYRINNV